MTWKIYIPDGEQDILAEECYMKRTMENAMNTVFRHCGFREIATPSMEFFDSFSGQRDIIPEENMIKFVDEQGRILVLKPDLTVPCARVAATKLKDCRPLRLCYCQNTFRSKKDRYLDLKEITQAGCEIIGIDEPDADAEIIATAIKTLKAAGLTAFTVEIGQVNYFKGLMNDTDLPFREKASNRPRHRRRSENRSHRIACPLRQYGDFNKDQRLSADRQGQSRGGKSRRRGGYS